jgi:GDP-L-fucose synthase
MVGGALVRRLEAEGCEVLTAGRAELDLIDQRQTFDWVATHKPDAIFMAAAKVGGILANSSYPAQFLYKNLVMQANIAEAARLAGTEKLMLLGSSCIYPKLAPQPIEEDALLTGPLEPTNQWYAIAKIAGIKLGESYRAEYGCDFISAMPTNLYGIGDNFDLETSHVVPALMRKAHEAKLSGAKQLVMWGTGTPRREFLYADDCADALVFLMRNYSDAQHVNVGSGEDLEIRELTRLVCDVVGFEGEIVADTTKPDGTPRKLMAADKLRGMGWSPKTSLRDGLAKTYAWFLENRA